MGLSLNSSVICTHNAGLPREQEHWPAPVNGTVELQTVESMELRRPVDVLRLLVPQGETGQMRDALPKLHDPVLVRFTSNRSAVFRGWEITQGRRFYQSWFVRLEAPVELDELYLLRREYKRVTGKDWNFKAAWEAERGNGSRP